MGTTFIDRRFKGYWKGSRIVFNYSRIVLIEMWTHSWWCRLWFKIVKKWVYWTRKIDHCPTLISIVQDHDPRNWKVTFANRTAAHGSHVLSKPIRTVQNYKQPGEHVFQKIRLESPAAPRTRSHETWDQAHRERGWTKTRKLEVATADHRQ